MGKVDLGGFGFYFALWFAFIMLYATAGKVAKVPMVEFVSLEVWEVSRLEPCKGKRSLLFNRRYKVCLAWNHAEIMGIRLKERGEGVFSISRSYCSSHISGVERFDLVGLIFRNHKVRNIQRNLHF